MAYDPRIIANFIIAISAARGQPVTNLALQKLLYLATIDSKRHVLSVDPKVSGLSPDGQRVVASIIQRRVIEETPQLASFSPAILAFPNVGKGRRLARLTIMPGTELFSLKNYTNGMS